MTLGLHENFPKNVHRVEGFNTNLPAKQVQQKLLQTLFGVNRREYAFEEVAIPTVPQGVIIFEFGLAQSEGYSYLDEAELETALDAVYKARLEAMDFFLAIRYYRVEGDKKSPLKFDYYLLRTLFGKEAVEIQVYHERGPRYVAPEDLIEFIVNTLNSDEKCKILKDLKSE